MDIERKPTTAKVNGQLWGARARDWAEIQEQSCLPVYHEVLKRAEVGNTTRYLDVGCGSGMAAGLAVDLGADVSGIDASEALLMIAKERIHKADFQLSDLEKIPFEDDSFDVVTGFNSFQYAGNPVLALGEARRVTKPGGTVAIVTWGNPEGMDAASLVAVLKPLLPPPPPGAPGPFALSDESRLREFASSAGLTPTDVFDVDGAWIYPDLDTAVRGMCSAGVAAKAMEHSGEEAVTSAYAAAFASFLQSDGTVRVGASFRCLVSQP
jgi:SAM-dependent methyltransferase